MFVDICHRLVYLVPVKTIEAKCIANAKANADARCARALILGEPEIVIWLAVSIHTARVWLVYVLAVGICNDLHWSVFSAFYALFVRLRYTE